jgi:signal transduction histidine kinase
MKEKSASFAEMRPILLFIYLTAILLPVTQAQPAGLPPSMVHLPEEYIGTNQIWAFATDNRGWVWAGLNNGVAVIYDGVTWHAVMTPYRNMIRNMLYDPSRDRMYAGCAGEFGYFEPDENQRFHFVSLAAKLSEPKPSFSDVWRVYNVNGKIHFQSRSFIFQFDPETESLSTEEDKDGVFLYYGDRVTVRKIRRGIALYRAEGNAWIEEPLGKDLLTSNIRNIYRNPDGTRLIVSIDSGLVRVAEDGSRVFDIRLQEANRFLKNERIYTMIPLSDGGWAAGTLRKGVFLLDKDFHYRNQFGENIGMADLNVWSLFEDPQGWLWIGTNYGMARVHLKWPIEVFGRGAGVRGIVENAVYTKDGLMLATSTGLLRWNGTGFERVEGINMDVWDVTVGKDSQGRERVFAAAADGVYEWNGKTAIKLMASDQVVFVAKLLQYQPDILLVGRKRDLMLFRLTKQGVSEPDIVPEVVDEIRQIAEMPDGSVWVERNYKGMQRFPAGYFSGKSTDKPKFFTRFGKPGNESFTKAVAVDGEVVIRTLGGYFRYDAKEDSFYTWRLPNSDTLIFQPTGYFFRKGEMWFKNDNGYYRPMKNQLVWDRGPFAVTQSFGIRWALDESDSTLLMGGNRGMFRLHIKPEWWERLPPEPQWVREREVAENRQPYLWPVDQKQIVPFGKRIFAYIAPGYSRVEKPTLFRTRVVGIDTSWSDWTENASRELERLPAGNYLLEAQTKNAFGLVSAVGRRQITVLPPWYQTRLAKVGTVLFFVLLLLLVALWVRQYYLFRQRKLEALITERTSDLRKEKERSDEVGRQLAEQTGLLRNAIEERRLLTGMVVHDLKNPISAVRGYAELIHSAAKNPEEVSELSVRIQRVSNRMLDAISQLLKKDSVETDLTAEPVNAGDIVLHALGDLMLIASRKDQTIKSRVEEDCFVRMPSERIAMVVENLVSNAIKYSHRGASILLELRKDQRTADNPVIRLRVQDQGLGLSSDDLKNLFTRYHTGTNKPTGGETASGLGLYVLKQTVEAYGGTISASSEGKGKGSIFEVSWPAV